MASLSETEQLRDFLDDDLLLFLSDEHTPTSEHTPTRTFIDSNSPQLTEKETDDFSTAFEELNHDNENQQTEVHNNDADNPVNVTRPSKASRNFAKPVCYKDTITEAMQKVVQSIEGTKRQYREALHNETILKYCDGANVFHCLRAWGLST